MRKLFILLFYILLIPIASANESSWEVYSTYSTYSQLVEHNGLLYIRSDNSVFFTDPDATSTESFTQLDGLSSSDVQFILKCEDTNSLVFVHNDGVVDILTKDNKINSIYDLSNKTIVGNKMINHATISGKSLFLACGFGFVEIDLISYTITNYHFTPSACSFAFSYAEGIYYALSKGGLWRCDKGKILANETNWSKLNDDTVKDVIVFSDDNTTQCWMVDSKKEIHILDTDGSYRRTSGRKCYEQLKSSGNYVFSKGWGFDIISKENQKVSYVQESPYSSCRDYYAVNDSIIYAIHPQRGLMKLSIEFHPNDHAHVTLLEESNNYFEIAGKQICKLAKNQDVIAGISGYKMIARGYTDMFLASANVNFYQDGKWTHITEEEVNSKKLAGKEFRGLTDIVHDPLHSNRFYVSTLTTGIYQFDGDSLSAHHFYKDRIASVYCDNDGILWATKDLKDTTLWAYNQQKDVWTPHPLPDFMQQSHVNRVFRQEHESHHLIWLLNCFSYHKSKISVVYNEGGSDDNTRNQTCYITTLKDQDDKLYPFSSAFSNVYDIFEDKEGKIWILTPIGPFVINDVIKAFNYAQKNPGIGLVTRIKVPRNDGTNLADYLLSNTTCTAMATDSFNRKWIGTLHEGVYLLSSDGLREIEHFTTDNSPLHSNDVTSLVYDEEAKQLFIASDGGVVVYHTESSEPAEDFSNIHCYPNPLRPDYYGDIFIEGLMAKTTVSITDSTGNRIWKATCDDGSINWNARNNNGDRVAPGVYLIHGISSSDSKGKICKLLVL